jgi:hypothetical protein
MAVDAARQDVMLAARGAATVLHHLSDFVFKEPSTALQFKNLEEVRRAISEKCVFLRTTSSVPDVWLLPDVADGGQSTEQIKHDGYRMIVHRDGPTVRLYTRNAYDWTVRLAAIAAVLGPDGVSRFEELSLREVAQTAILYLRPHRA